MQLPSQAVCELFDFLEDVVFWIKDAMAQAWRRAGGPGEVLDLAGHNHSSILWELSDPSTRLARAIQAQIGASQNRAGAPRVC
jgi:hypothetical protein